MIYVTGDTHGEVARMKELLEQIQKEAGSERKYLIVCGDFGYIFTDNAAENEFLDFIAQAEVTVCFCDGNHENFPAIGRYPEELWNGGRVHRIRDNIIHLMRGQIYSVEGKSIFVMGGAYSIDRSLRMRGISYWPEELPNAQEYREASENLKKHHHQVDIIISHTAPREIICGWMGKIPDAHDAELTGFLEWIMYEVKFQSWFFGHWHMDKVLNQKFTALWFDVVRIP